MNWYYSNYEAYHYNHRAKAKSILSICVDAWEKMIVSISCDSFFLPNFIIFFQSRNTDALNSKFRQGLLHLLIHTMDPLAEPSEYQ